MTTRLTLVQKAVVLLSAVAVFLVNFKPSELLREAVLKAFGTPAYEGVWVLIPHVFLYTTLTALAAMVAWILLSRAGWIAKPWFASLRPATVAWSLLVGLVGAAIALGYVAFAMPGVLHGFQFEPWAAAGNLFSNLFEEIVFRGFLLAALAAVFGFWPAAVLSSIAFGYVHTQYPLDLQVMVGVIGLGWCWLVRKARTVWAPYLSHTVLDAVADPFL